MTFLRIIFLSTALLSASHAQAWKGIIHLDLPALKKQAESGDPSAMAEYAFHSMRCLGDIPYQPNLIFEYFRKSAATGNTEGKVGLAHCYCFNVGTTQDLRKAQALIKGPLAQDHPVALKINAFFYYGHQHLRERNLSKVLEYNRKSAEKGCLAASYNVALNLISPGPDQDLTTCLESLRKIHEEKSFPMASGRLLSELQKHNHFPDQKELIEECLTRLKKYATLNEPYALYQLARFQLNAGDQENAIAHFAQSAHLGYGSAWFQLWRIRKFGHHQGGQGIIWTDDQSLGNIAMRAYDRGVFTNDSLADAGWEITRRSWNEGYQKKLPLLEKDLIAGLKEGKCDLHNILGRLYVRAQKHENPDLLRPEWAKQHLIAHSHHGPGPISELAEQYLKGPKSTENLAKGYAASELAIAGGDQHWARKDVQKWRDQLMTPEALKRAKELIKDKFPIGEKHRLKAQDFLIKIGHLPPPRNAD